MVPLPSLQIPRVCRYSGYKPSKNSFRLRDYHSLWSAFPRRSTINTSNYVCPYPEIISNLGLASSNFARHYFRNLVWFLFLSLLRCFSSGGSLPCTYVFSQGYTVLHRMGFPIRKSAGQSLFPTHRSLSQVIASFIGSQCQGIHLTLFFAWTAVLLFSILIISYESSKQFSFYCLSFANNCFWVVN